LSRKASTSNGKSLGKAEEEGKSSKKDLSKTESKGKSSRNATPSKTESKGSKKSIAAEDSKKDVSPVPDERVNHHAS
jgi:hypothetical protein